MRASLDTNVIIHLYKAELQSVLFDVFDDGVFIYEQIRNVELENHGRDVLEAVDADISSGKGIFTCPKHILFAGALQKLKSYQQGVLKQIFIL